jgi:hypothetical protein
MTDPASMFSSLPNLVTGFLTALKASQNQASPEGYLAQLFFNKVYDSFGTTWVISCPAISKVLQLSARDRMCTAFRAFVPDGNGVTVYAYRCFEPDGGKRECTPMSTFKYIPAETSVRQLENFFAAGICSSSNDPAPSTHTHYWTINDLGIAALTLIGTIVFERVITGSVKSSSWAGKFVLSSVLFTTVIFLRQSQ